MGKLLLFLSVISTTSFAYVQISGDPSPLIASKARAGEEPLPCIDTSTTLTILPPKEGVISVTVQALSPLPNGTTLSITAQGFSRKVAISTIPQVLIFECQDKEPKTIPLVYEYAALVAAGIVPPTRTSLLFTVIDKPGTLIHPSSYR